MRSRRVVALVAPVLLAGALVTAALTTGAAAATSMEAAGPSDRVSAPTSQVAAITAEVTVDAVVPARPAIGDRETARSVAPWRTITVIASVVALIAVVWSRRRRDGDAPPLADSVVRSWARFRAPPTGFVPAPRG